MTQDTFKAWRKAYKDGADYSRTPARQGGDGAALQAYAKATFADEQACKMFIAGVYDQESIDFYSENPDYVGNGWF